MSFAAMSAIAENPIAPAPLPDVIGPQMRLALGAISRDEALDLFKNEMVNWNTLNRIELKTPEITKELPDNPRHYLFPDVLTTVNANVPAMLVGPAGSGKSTMSEQIAEALDLKYYLQNAVGGTHELSGYQDAYGNYKTTTFRMAFENGGLFFIDEVDSSDAGALKWLNTALANGHAMFPDQADPVNRHPKFRVIAGANTFGTGADRMYVGANQLDASTLDRFVFFEFGYDEKLETLLSGNAKWAERVQEIRKAAFAEKARIVVSPRATIYGAKLLAAGWTQEVVEDRVVWKGIDAELKRRILDKVAGVLTEAELEDKKGNKKDKKKFKFN